MVDMYLITELKGSALFTAIETYLRRTECESYLFSEDLTFEDVVRDIQSFEFTLSGEDMWAL